MPKVKLQAASKQSQDDRRKLRQLLKTNRDALEQRKAQAVRADNDVLLRSVLHGNTVFKHKVVHARDAVEDTKHLGLAAELGIKQAQNLATPFSSIDPRTLADSIKGHFTGRGGTMDWLGLGVRIGGLWRSSPTTRFFKGRLNAERKKPRKKSVRRGKDAPVAALRPDTKHDDRVTSDGATAKRDLLLQHRLKQLNKEAPEVPMGGGVKGRRLPMFDTLIDPDSFSKTVEHLFYYAFLVKDGTGSIELDIDGIPVIAQSEPYGAAPLTAEEAKRYEHFQAIKEREPSQNIISIDMDQWLEMRRVIRQPKAKLEDFGRGKPRDLRVALSNEVVSAPALRGLLAANGAGAGAGAGAGGAAAEDDDEVLFPEADAATPAPRGKGKGKGKGRASGKGKGKASAKARRGAVASDRATKRRRTAGAVVFEFDESDSEAEYAS